MFEDRTRYDFNKIDKNARVVVEIEDKKAEKSEAHKKLFGPKQQVSMEKQKEEIKQAIVQKNLDNLPSASYLKSFENQVVPEEPEEDKNDIQMGQSQSEIDFVSLLQSETNTQIDTNKIANEIKNAEPKPKKNYSFRIKLVTGVYCILVALFGGWVIGNAVTISKTNANLYETLSESTQINQNILDILGDLAKLDSVSANPEDDTIVVKIATEEIEITPEAINKPNDYEKESNWFDIICNWIASIFD